MTDKDLNDLADKFIELHEKWKEINNHPFYKLGKYYEHKVVWNKITPMHILEWLTKNCKDKFSLDLMEHEKDYCTWEDKTHLSFVNKDDAMHFKMVWCV